MIDISVVLITCNRPPEIFLRAYNSVCNQTHVPKEFIIVNAGSSILPPLTSGTLINAPGSNASIARNIGEKYITSEYVAFLDDDDEWCPKHLESHIQLLCKEIGLIYSDRIDKCKADLKEKNLMVRNWIGPTSFVTISKECFDTVGGFDESFASNQEWDLWIRINNITLVKKCEKYTVIKHDSKDSISANIKKRISGWESLLKKYQNTYKKSPDAYYRVTKVFKDEMHAKHSPYGTLIAEKWYIRAIINQILNKNNNQ